MIVQMFTERCAFPSSMYVHMCVHTYVIEKAVELHSGVTLEEKGTRETAVERTAIRVWR